MNNNIPSISFSIPEGYVIDTAKSTDNNLVFKHIRVKIVPDTEEEFCKKCKVHKEFYINTFSTICESQNPVRYINNDKNLISNINTAKAFLALIHLVRIRDYVNDGWKPDFTDTSIKYVISNYLNEIHLTGVANTNYVLIFKTKEIRDEFYSKPYIKELLETAKELL